MTPQTFIFFGPSGSGKGTQAKLLIDILKQKDPGRKVLYLETGERLREFTQEASLTAKLTKEVLNNGALMPEFIPIWVWTEFFIRHISGDEHLVMDGSPRKIDEAQILNSALKFYKRNKANVISIEVSEEWATARMLNRRRSDDNENDIRERLRWYKENVTPSIAYFKNNPDGCNFFAINGEQSIEEVHQEILQKIGL